ncbi:MAG: PEP-CTERM sorting domain-containing protein [Phycisphaerae bacterium]
MRRTLLVIGSAAFVAQAHAAIITVTAEGAVVSNAVTTAPLDAVGSGDSATLTFQVDSNVFLNGVPGDTRGYEIIQPSFSLAFDAPPVSVGLLSPFPAGQTPYFTLVEGFPVSDGFFVSTTPFSPGGVPISQSPLQMDLDLGYVGSTLGSLDILDALGTYDFTGLTRFSFTLWQVSPDNVRLEIDFSRLTIIPEPGTIGALALLGLFAFRVRR